MIQEQIAGLETQLAKAHKEQERAKSLERLRKNRDFVQLIEIGYLRDEAVRLVQVKSNPGTQNTQAQAGIIRDIDAIGSFTQFLDKIARDGEGAEKSIRDTDSELEELRKEVI